MPLNRQAHPGLRLPGATRSYSFAGEAHMIPAEEFTAAASLPIVFLPRGERPVPVFLTGFTSG